MGHTKGPWQLSKPYFGEQHIYAYSDYSVGGKSDGSGRQHICVIPYEGKKGAIAYHEMFNANARLISAAPDMLEALQYLMTAHGDQLHDAFDMARKAIAKATGESNEPT